MHRDDRLVTSSTTSYGTTTIQNCIFINEEIALDRHASTLKNQNIVLRGNTIEGYNRGVNIQGPGTGSGSFEVYGNTFRDFVTENEGAVQIADGMDGISVDVR